MLETREGRGKRGHLPEDRIEREGCGIRVPVMSTCLYPYQLYMNPFVPEVAYDGAGRGI